MRLIWAPLLACVKEHIWQLAYTEFTFPEVFWPDFRRQHLYEAIEDYQKRQRRFGKTGDQLFEDKGEAS